MRVVAQNLSPELTLVEKVHFFFFFSRKKYICFLLFFPWLWFTVCPVSLRWLNLFTEVGFSNHNRPPRIYDKLIFNSFIGLKFETKLMGWCTDCKIFSSFNSTVLHRRVEMERIQWYLNLHPSDITRIWIMPLSTRLPKH